MKRALVFWICISLLTIAIGLPALAESYPVYEVVIRPAFLRSDMQVTEDYILTSVPIHTMVLVKEETDGWCLVYTQEKMIGYMHSSDLSATGKKYTLDFAIRAEDVTDKASIDRDMITVDPQAVLPDEAALEKAYPATIARGEQLYDLPFLLEKLLGDGYLSLPRNEYAYEDEYKSTASDKPDRRIHIDDRTGALWYYDGMVIGERYGEYTPPAMNMTLDESLIFCKALLNGLVEYEWLAHPGTSRSLEARWGNDNRWMTDSEYDSYIRNMDAHWIVFEHWTADGIRILDDELLAVVGVNGLAELSIDWHDFKASTAPQMRLMPLEDALALAGSTRMTETVLLSAAPVYSNWLTEGEDFNLSWYLITSEGNYVVDCVLNRHKCTNYEY